MFLSADQTQAELSAEGVVAQAEYLRDGLVGHRAGVQIDRMGKAGIGRRQCGEALVRQCEDVRAA